MSVESEVKAALDRIKAWAAKQKEGKHLLVSFLKPATKADIAAFEKKTKLKLPAALEALYLLHDGQDEQAANEAYGEGTIESGIFPSLERGDLPYLLVPLKELARNTTGSHMEGFRQGWIPFGDNYGGDNLVIDLASEDPKKRGRVLQFNHETCGAYCHAKSFEEYLEMIASGLEKKTLVWDEDAGISFKKGKDWDDLIEAGKVEYDPALKVGEEDEDD